MENKTKVIQMAASALVGMFFGMAIMYAMPLQDNINASVTATQQAVIAASTVKSGVVYKIGGDAFAIYTTQGTQHEIKVNEKTQFSEIIKRGIPTTVKSFADLKMNYYALAILDNPQDPTLASSVTFKVFDKAPFPFISSTSTLPVTTPASTGTTTTPASTSTGTTAAPTGTTSTDTTSASTSTTTTSATNVAPTSTSTPDMTAAPTGATSTTPEATSSATTIAPSAGTSSDMTSAPTTPETTPAPTGTEMTPAPSN